MDTDLEWVAPDAPVEEVGRRMLARHPRFVLVGDRTARRAEGLVTRMQVLRHLHGRLTEEGEAVDRRALHQPTERREVAKLLAERLPPALQPRVEAAAEVSRELGVPVYLVGGLVRDLVGNARSQAMVTAIVQLAQTMRLKTTAECVESESILSAVGQLGVTYGQGFAIGRPRALEIVLQELLRGAPGIVRSSGSPRMARGAH